MPSNQFHYLPLAPAFFSLLVGVLVVVVVLIQLGVLRYAYTRLGVGARPALLLLFGSLIGSYINIPIAALPAEQLMSGRDVIYFGMHYVVPVVVDWPGTVIAVNVGGALIPGLMSIYLLARNRLWGVGLVATACVTAVCHQLADPVPGIGIALPVLVPALSAAFVALLLSRAHAMRRRWPTSAAASARSSALISSISINCRGWVRRSPPSEAPALSTASF